MPYFSLYKEEGTLCRSNQNSEIKAQAWKWNLLSYGGKDVLIMSVLQSVYVHVLSVVVPPKCVKELHRIFA